VILPWRGVAALHTGGYRGSAQFARRRMEKGTAASWTMEKDVATSPRQTSRMHASYFSYLLQRMKKFSSSWHVHSTQSPTGIDFLGGLPSQPLYSRKIANSLCILAMVFAAS